MKFYPYKKKGGGASEVLHLEQKKRGEGVVEF